MALSSRAVESTFDELQSTAETSEETVALLELAQAQLAEERARHETSKREAEAVRAHLSGQLSASLADLAKAREGTRALLEEMEEWNYFKAVVACQRIIRRRKDARQFRFLLREAVQQQKATSALETSLRECRQQAKEHEARSKAELDLMHAACLDSKSKQAAAEAEARQNADLASQAAIEAAALRRQLEIALHSSSMSEARGTDELSTLHMQLSAAQAEAKSNAEAAARASTDAQSAWSANAEMRAHWEQTQTAAEAARTKLETELQQSAATHAAQLAELQMQISAVEASARSELSSAVRNQESALRGELSAANAALFAAETALKLKSEEIIQLRLESKKAQRVCADTEAATQSATEQRDIHEQARQDAEAKCLAMETSLMEEKATLQSLLFAVETKLTDADQRMSSITAQALREATDQKNAARNMKETTERRLVQASLRRLRRHSLTKALHSWQNCVHRRADTKNRMYRVAVRIQHMLLASALRGWQESAARARRLRNVCERSIRRMQNATKAQAFAALLEHRRKKKQKLLDQHDRSVVIEEMRDLMYGRAVAICQRAVRRKRDAKALKSLAQETATLRLQVHQMEHTVSEADAVRTSQLSQQDVHHRQQMDALGVEMSEATAKLQTQLVEQDECFRIELREMQKSLIDTERELVEKQQYDKIAEQLQAQEAAESLSMQEDLLAQAEALIADKQQLDQREAALVKREARLHPSFSEIDAVKEALANERAERAKDRVARQRLEERLRKQIEHETGQTKHVEALQRRVQEQQKLLARMQAKKATSEVLQQPQAVHFNSDDHLNRPMVSQRSPTRPRRSSPRERQTSPLKGARSTQKTANDVGDQSQCSWVGPYRPHEPRSPLSVEERKEQGKAMLWSHGTSASRAKSPASSGADDQSQSSWFGPHKPHEPRSPLPAEERKAQGKAMLWSHGTAAARGTTKSILPPAIREEIRSLSSALEAQVQAQEEVNSDCVVAEAPDVEQLAAAEEVSTLRAEAVAMLKQGVRLDMFFATGKLKHGRWFWLGSDTASGQVTLSWGKVVHAAARSSKTEVLRSVTDGPSLATPGSLFDALDKDRDGSLDGVEVGALYRQARGEKLGKKALAKALADMDTDGSGAVGRDEFLCWWGENAASDLERLRDRALTVELGDEGSGKAVGEATVLRLVASSVESKDQVLLGLQAAVRGEVVVSA